MSSSPNGIWNTGLVPGSSNIWPGSNFGGNKPGDSSTGAAAPNLSLSGVAGGGNVSPAMMLDDPIHNFNATKMMIPDSSGSNGLNLAGTWASSGFGGSQGPSSGFNFFNPQGNPGNSNFSAVPFSANGIGTPSGIPGVANPSSPFSTGFSGTVTGASGFPALPGVDAKSLDKIYGKGVGNALSQFLSSGAGFNPAVEQAQFNQAQPVKAQALAKMQTMFGDKGDAYSSTAAIGYGDYSSQFDAALQGQFAQEYQQSVQNYLNVLMGVKGDAQQEKSQEPNWLSISSEIVNALGDF